MLIHSSKFPKSYKFPLKIPEGIEPQASITVDTKEKRKNK